MDTKFLPTLRNLSSSLVLLEAVSGFWGKGSYFLRADPGFSPSKKYPHYCPLSLNLYPTWKMDEADVGSNIDNRGFQVKAVEGSEDSNARKHTRGSLREGELDQVHCQDRRSETHHGTRPCGTSFRVTTWGGMVRRGGLEGKC